MIFPSLLSFVFSVSGADMPPPVDPDAEPIVRKPVAARMAATKSGNAPIVGTRRYLVVPVRFPDRDTTFSVDSLSRAFDGPGPALTVRRYFNELSKGKLDVEFEFLPWMTASFSRDSLGSGAVNEDSYQDSLLKAVGLYAQAKGVDLTRFDNDATGYADGLIVVHTGTSSQMTGDPKDPITLYASCSVARLAGGVMSRHYIQVPEIAKGLISDPGSIAHEIGHSMGLPDLYDTYSGAGTCGGVGSWDLMSDGNRGMGWRSGSYSTSGGWAPTGLSAYNRELLGWAAPMEIQTRQQVRLGPGESARLWTDSLRSREYLMLENRELFSLDSILPGPGLQVMRVRPPKILPTDSRVAKAVNGDSSFMGVEVLEASGLQRISQKRSYQPVRDDLFGIASDSLTDAGPVPLRSRTGEASGAWLRNIRVDGRDVVFEANPSRQIGYGVGYTGRNQTYLNISQTQETALLTPLKIPSSGKIVGLESVVHQYSYKACVGIWKSRPAAKDDPPLVSFCDLGSNPVWLTQFHHELAEPISVVAGQVVWVGQIMTRDPAKSVIYCVGEKIEPSVDTVWRYNATGTPYLYSYRPPVGLLIKSDTGTASVPGNGSASGLRIETFGDRVLVVGATPGESIEVAVRGLDGRILSSRSLVCDARGEAGWTRGSHAEGLVVVDVQTSSSRRIRLLTRP
jgi:M6 family metalloprotease-like protein